jgi:ATPase subunit of ABC transporter with duplicated ATPase domains
MVVRSHSRQSQIDHFGGDTRSGLFGNSLSEHSGTRPGILYSYDGKYAAFLEQKEARLALKDAAMQNLKANYNAELESMRRQPQARQSKSKLRIDAFLQIATGHDLKIWESCREESVNSEGPF